jgi:hypothetical protein
MDGLIALERIYQNPYTPPECIDRPHQKIYVCKYCKKPFERRYDVVQHVATYCTKNPKYEQRKKEREERKNELMEANSKKYSKQNIEIL